MPLNQADLDAVGKVVAAAIIQAQPRRTLGSWFVDNGTSLAMIAGLVAAALAFNGRMDHVEAKLDQLVQHVDDDFRFLSATLSSLDKRLSVDEATAPKPRPHN